MEMSGQLPAPATFPWGRSPQYPLDKRLGGPKSQSECSGKEESLPHLGFKHWLFSL